MVGLIGQEITTVDQFQPFAPGVIMNGAVLLLERAAEEERDVFGVDTARHPCLRDAIPVLITRHRQITLAVDHANEYAVFR